MSETIEIAAVVLHFGEARQTVECVHSLLLQDAVRDLRIVLVNNDPDQRRAEQLRAQLADERIVHHWEPSNPGYAIGNNVGLRIASTMWRPRYVAVVNNDILLERSDVIAKMLRLMDAHSDVAVAQPLVRLPGGFIQAGYGRPSLWGDCLGALVPIFWFARRAINQSRLRRLVKPLPVFRVAGSMFVARTDSLPEVGFFDEGTFLEREEDILGEKCMAAGLRTAVVPVNGVLHRQHSRRTRLDPRIRAADRHYFRNWRGYGEAAVRFRELCLTPLEFLRTNILRD